ncbi:hypothetical protein DSO57_1010190 [Entomophthora muscae]|uniref:Uncharacterized protein n=1 Tax=Entomophthora muscae TaxID=34485 RepID=A0ACC2URL3_9FUNG|nr:hypothetical protein DSO57_1010190 [Entomophthora muscae]
MTNTNCCFSTTFKVYLQAVTAGNASLYLSLAAATYHFMWYPPESCQPGQPGYNGCCLEHYCSLACQLCVPLTMREGAKLTNFGSHPGETNHQDVTQWSTGISALRGDQREDTGEN